MSVNTTAKMLRFDVTTSMALALTRRGALTVMLTLPAPVALTLNVVRPSPTASVTLAGQAALPVLSSVTTRL
jgi:hypothetical protein